MHVFDRYRSIPSSHARDLVDLFRWLFAGRRAETAQRAVAAKPAIRDESHRRRGHRRRRMKAVQRAVEPGVVLGATRPRWWARRPACPARTGQRPTSCQPPWPSTRRPPSPHPASHAPAVPPRSSAPGRRALATGAVAPSTTTWRHTSGHRTRGRGDDEPAQGPPVGRPNAHSAPPSSARTVGAVRERRAARRANRPPGRVPNRPVAAQPDEDAAPGRLGHRLGAALHGDGREGGVGVEPSRPPPSAAESSRSRAAIRWCATPLAGAVVTP